MKRFFSHKGLPVPSSAHLFFVCWLLSITLYLKSATGAWLVAAGYLDDMAFIFTALFAFEMVRLIKPPKAAVAILSFAFLISVLFFWGSLMHLRFFNRWASWEIFKQFADLPAVADSMDSLSRPLDLVFLLIVPAGFFIAGCIALPRENPRRVFSRTRLGVYVAGVVVCVLLQWATGRGGAIAGETNPAINMIRQAVVSYRENREGLARLGASLNIARSAQKSRVYEYADSDEFPLMKRPLKEYSQAKTDASRPNVVVILLESVRAYESMLYNRFNFSYTPNIDRLARAGLFARNFYANSTATVNGEFSILASAYSEGTLTTYKDHKDIRVKTLPSILKSRGYKTMWVSGYTADYGSKRGFLESHGFDEIHDTIKDPALVLGWGPSDEDILQSALDKIAKTDGPFFMEVLTLSNHFDWEYPYPSNQTLPPVVGTGMYTQYVRGVYYTDYALGRFMQKARLEPWFENTVFIIVGDHGNIIFPDTASISEVRINDLINRVPLVIYSPALVEPREVHVPSSQVDIMPTVLDILGIYEDNSFAGTSMLRKEQGEGFVFFNLPDKWYLRVNDDYCFTANNASSLESDDIKKGAQSDAGAGHTGEQTSAAGQDGFTCFNSKTDLMYSPKGNDISALEPAQRARMIEAGRSMHFLTSYLLDNDRIGP